ncbi:MAG: M3 family metallopeptidase [Clostridiaceae bacterium]
MKNIYEIAEKLYELDQQYNRLSWSQYTTGYDFGTSEAYNKILGELSSKENFEIVEKEYNESSTDLAEKRKAEIMYNWFQPYHLSKEANELSIQIQKLTTQLSQILNTHRSKIDGVEISSVDIGQILSADDDREKRKKAYFARAQVNKPLVDGGFCELVKLRKEYADKRGFHDFVEMRLKDDGLSPDIFNGWKKQVHKALPAMKDARQKAAEKYINDSRIMPWDESYISSKIAPSLNTKVDMLSYYSIIKNIFMKFGIDISKFNITYDVFSRANKSEWGYNFQISTGKDTRILANVKNLYKEYNVLMHETGHAVHSYLLDPKEIILNYGVSGIISEGIANLFGGLIYEEIFYKDFFGQKDCVKNEFAEIKKYSKINALRAIDTILFDQELYRNEINSLQDINELAFKNQKEVLNEEPFGDEYPWGYRIHHTECPIYLHNYFMGDVTCEMLKKVFCHSNSCITIMDKPIEFSKFLMDNVINSSGLYKYPELFKKISGEDFSLKYIL